MEALLEKMQFHEGSLHTQIYLIDLYFIIDLSHLTDACIFQRSKELSDLPK